VHTIRNPSRIAIVNGRSSLDYVGAKHRLP
jgi:hypothetical protein